MRTLSQNCEQTLQKLRTNRIMNKRAFLKKKDFLFSLWGDPVQNRTQNPALASCLFSTRETRSQVPGGGDFGEQNCLGKGGVDSAKKGFLEKRMRKRRWFLPGEEGKSHFRKYPGNSMEIIGRREKTPTPKTRFSIWT